MTQQEAEEEITVDIAQEYTSRMIEVADDIQINSDFNQKTEDKKEDLNMRHLNLQIQKTN